MRSETLVDVIYYYLLICNVICAIEVEGTLHHRKGRIMIM